MLPAAAWGPANRGWAANAPGIDRQMCYAGTVFIKVLSDVLNKLCPQDNEKHLLLTKNMQKISASAYKTQKNSPERLFFYRMK